MSAEELASRRDLSRNPPVRATFSIENEPIGRSELVPGVAFTPEEAETGTATLYLYLSLTCWNDRQPRETT